MGRIGLNFGSILAVSSAFLPRCRALQVKEKSVCMPDFLLKALNCFLMKTEGSVPDDGVIGRKGKGKGKRGRR